MIHAKLVLGAVALLVFKAGAKANVVDSFYFSQCECLQQAFPSQEGSFFDGPFQLEEDGDEVFGCPGDGDSFPVSNGIQATFSSTFSAGFETSMNSDFLFSETGEENNWSLLLRLKAKMSSSALVKLFEIKSGNDIIFGLDLITDLNSDDANVNVSIQHATESSSLPTSILPVDEEFHVIEILCSNTEEEGDNFCSIIVDEDYSVSTDITITPNFVDPGEDTLDFTILSGESEEAASVVVLESMIFKNETTTGADFDALFLSLRPVVLPTVVIQRAVELNENRDVDLLLTNYLTGGNVDSGTLEFSLNTTTLSGIAEVTDGVLLFTPAEDFQGETRLSFSYGITNAPYTCFNTGVPVTFVVSQQKTIIDAKKGVSSLIVAGALCFVVVAIGRVIEKRSPSRGHSKEEEKK